MTRAEHPISGVAPALAGGPDGEATERSGRSSTHFLVVDDHPLFREALTTTLARAFPDSRPHEAEGVEAAFAVLEAHREIDLILLDLSMQGVTSFEGLIGIRVRFPRVPVLVVSGHEDPQVARDVIQHGAAGFVPKSLCKATLIEAINDVLGGALFFPPSFAEAAPVAPSRKASLPERIARLTPQQMRVLGMIRQGLLNKQIAHELQVGSSTVKAHVSEILRKLEVSSRTQIVIATADLDRGLKAYGP